MKINIEFYGRLKDEFSQEPIEISIQNSESSLEHIYLDLCKSHQVTPNTKVIKPILNDTFADWQNQVKAGDVVGFFPPASGG